MSELIVKLLSVSVAMPFVVALLLMIFRGRQEKLLSRVSIVGAAAWLAVTAATVTAWLMNGGELVQLSFGDLYASGSFTFPMLFVLDESSVAFLAVSAFLGTLIVKYCRHYLHREDGYARFFITIFFFLGGMSVISCAGTFEIFFAGWEILGASSFLLIGFYRDRPTAQKNALRAFVIYRICDVGLLLGAWLSHLVWHETRSFVQLSLMPPDAFAQLGVLPLVGLSFLVLLAASGKW